MQIEIPQYIEAFVSYIEGRRAVDVYIGDALVYRHKCNAGNPMDDHEKLIREGVTAFGKMLALKIGD